MGLFNLFETPEEKERKRIAEQIAFIQQQGQTQTRNYVGGDPVPPLERPKPWEVERTPLGQETQPAPTGAKPWQAPMPWRFNPETNDVELLRGGEGTPGTAGTQGTPAGNQTIGHLPSSFDVQMQRERERAQVPLAPSQPTPAGQPLQINGRTFVQNPRQTQADFDRQMASNIVRQVRPDGTVSNVGFAGKSVLEAGNPQANAQAQQDYWKQAAGTNSAMRRMGVGVTKENQARLLEGDVAAAQKQERELKAISAVTGVQAGKTALEEKKLQTQKDIAAQTAQTQRDIAENTQKTQLEIEQGKRESEEKKRQMTETVQRLRNEGQTGVANIYAVASQDKQKLAADTDLAIAELNKQGKTEAATILSQNRMKIDPTIWLTATDEQKTQILKSIAPGGNPETPGTQETTRTQGAQTTAAPSRPGAPATGTAVEGATATNPQTGQKWVRRGGKWVPV